VGPVRWDTPTQVAGSVQLPFNAIVGRRYAVESAAVVQGPYALQTEVVGQAGGTFVADPIGGEGRFYRVRPMP